MAQLTDAALIQARDHVARIAKRVESAGFRSSTLSRLQANLAEPGPVLVPSDCLTQLQFRAGELASVLAATDTRGSLGGTDLPQLRLLLTGAGVTYVPLHGNQPATQVADLAAEVRAAIADAWNPAGHAYTPGAR